jgi:hypothetical protein
MESLINLLRNINEPFGNDNTYIILTNKLQESINKLKRNISDEELNIINQKYKNIKMKTDSLIENDNLKNLFDYFQITNVNYFLKNRILVNLIIKFLLLKKKYDSHKHLNNALDNLMNTSNPLNTSAPPFVPGNPLNTSAHISSSQVHPPPFASSQVSAFDDSHKHLNNALDNLMNTSNPLNTSAPQFVPGNPLNISAHISSSQVPPPPLASSQLSNVSSLESSQVPPPPIASSQVSASDDSSGEYNTPAFSISGADGPNQNDINQTFYYYEYDSITNRYSYINKKRNIVIVFGDLGWEIKKKDILRGFAKNLCFTGTKQQGITPDICSQTEWNIFDKYDTGIPSFKKGKLTFKKLGSPPLNLSTLPPSLAPSASSQSQVLQPAPSRALANSSQVGDQRRLPVLQKLSQDIPVTVGPTSSAPSQDSSASSLASSSLPSSLSSTASSLPPSKDEKQRRLPIFEHLAEGKPVKLSSEAYNPSSQVLPIAPSRALANSSQVGEQRRLPIFEHLAEGKPVQLSSEAYNPSSQVLPRPPAQDSSAPARLNESVTKTFPKNLQLTEHPTIPGLFLQPDLASVSQSSTQQVPIQDEEQRRKSTPKLPFTKEDAARLVNAPEFIPQSSNAQIAGNNDKYFKKYLKYKSKYLNH